ncbi:glucosaminidase domain-containing protein [Candidatus Saccharibacteria bacterium]|nr:glucosaminidase domain-containing protein [Candidatus Saccharibacteria bacterium]
MIDSKVIKHKNRRFFWRALCRATFLFFLINLLVFSPSYTLAIDSNGYIIDDDTLTEYAQNGIYFYNSKESNCITSSITSSGNSDGSDVYIIGDSITVLSKNQILEKLPKATVNALSGTYFSANSSFGPGGTERISNMGNQDILVFAMGSNGGIDYTNSDDTAKLFSALNGKNVQVILMTIFYNGMASEQMNKSNEVVKKLANDYQNVTYLDWYSAVSSDPSQYIASDGIHPTDPTGREKFAEILTTAVNKVTKMTTTESSTSGGATSAKLSSQQIEFVDKYHDIAEKLSIEYGIPWEAVMAQGIIESGAGTSHFARDRNNFFGIGAFDSNPNNAFHYDTPEEGWRGYYENIRKTSVYRSVGAFSGDRITDPYAYIAAIAKPYATGEYYRQSVSKVIQQLEILSKDRGWASSAQLASMHPEMLTNAAANAQGAGSEPNVVSSEYGSAQYCNETNNTNSNGVTTLEINGTTYAFPIAYATKENYLQPGSKSVLSPLPCTNYDIGACHHDHVALDLGIDLSMVSGATTYTSSNFTGSGTGFSDMYYYSTGAEVVALVDGTITGYSYYDNNVPSDYIEQCASVSYQGNDGNSYWLGHMSYESKYSVGQTFKAGDVIGHVGPPPCAQNTQAHLHINIQPQSANNTKIYDILNKLYEALPANEAELNAREASASQSGDGDQPIAPLYESSVDIACDSRTTDIGTDTGYHVNGKRPNYTSFQIRLCALNKPGYQITGSDYGTGHNTGGYAIVNSRVSGAYAALAHKYYIETGNTLQSNTSFRNMAYQTALYRQKGFPDADYPGCSRHQGGLAIDFAGTNGGNWNTPISKWFKNNLGAFGLDRPLSSEAWHVEPSSSIKH